MVGRQIVFFWYVFNCRPKNLRPTAPRHQRACNTGCRESDFSGKWFWNLQVPFLIPTPTPHLHLSCLEIINWIQSRIVWMLDNIGEEGRAVSKSQEVLTLAVVNYPELLSIKSHVSWEFKIIIAPRGRIQWVEYIHTSTYLVFFLQYKQDLLDLDGQKISLVHK